MENQITDPNCIVKAFEKQNIFILHEEINNKKNYYFRGSDVANVLGITNIRSSIQNFTDKEKGVRKVDTLGGPQDIIFLSSHGVYRLLYSSKKKVAEQFREWVGYILDDIIFNESRELQKQIEQQNKELEKQKRLIEEKEQLIEEKEKEIYDKEEQHMLDKKLEKHKFLWNKFQYKKCIYIGEIMYNNMRFIKIGSTENISERIKKHNEIYGNFILLDVFESEHYRSIESDILSDSYIKNNLYRTPINGHNSKECVAMSELFNFDQLMDIVKRYVYSFRGLTGEQLLEKQKLELEKQKLEYELIYKLMYNDKYIDIIKNKINEGVNININLTDRRKNIQSNTTESPLKKDETNNENYNLTLETKVLGRKPKGRKVQKIDPLNFSNFTVYESMVYVLRAPENKGFQKSGIQTAIKDNRIYKNFRWNFVESDQDPNIVNIEPTQEYKSKPPIIDSILEINSEKTEITNSFYTKDYLAEFLKIAKLKTRKIIENNELYNNHYYIEYHKCPSELIEKYDKPINRIIPPHSKKIKQIHPITKNVVIFNSFTEISNKFGIASKTIIKAIEAKCVYFGFLWEYV